MTSWKEILKKLNDYAGDDAILGVDFDQLSCANIHPLLITNGFKINFLFRRNEIKGIYLEKRDGFYLSVMNTPDSCICRRIDTTENIQELQELFDRAIGWLETARTTEDWHDGPPQKQSKRIASQREKEETMQVIVHETEDHGLRAKHKAYLKDNPEITGTGESTAEAFGYLFLKIAHSLGFEIKHINLGPKGIITPPEER